MEYIPEQYNCSFYFVVFFLFLLNAVPFNHYHQDGIQINPLSSSLLLLVRVVNEANGMDEIARITTAILHRRAFKLYTVLLNYYRYLLKVKRFAVFIYC